MLLDTANEKLGWPSQDQVLRPSGAGPSVYARLVQSKLGGALIRRDDVSGVEIGILAGRPEGRCHRATPRCCMRIQEDCERRGDRGSPPPGVEFLPGTTAHHSGAARHSLVDELRAAPHPSGRNSARSTDQASSYRPATAHQFLPGGGPKFELDLACIWTVVPRLRPAICARSVPTRRSSTTSRRFARHWWTRVSPSKQFTTSSLG